MNSEFSLSLKNIKKLANGVQNDSEDNLSYDKDRVD
jgi:hypothetical protein